MAAPHADGEDLARLAMQDEVPADVAGHVAECAECSRDLALIRSLLDAEGPDGPDIEAATPGLEDPAEVTDAWADANDSGPGSATATAAQPPTEQPTEANAQTASQGGRQRNTTALAVALLLFLGAILLAFFALR